MTWRTTAATINEYAALFESAWQLLADPGAGDMYSLEAIARYLAHTGQATVHPRAQGPPDVAA